jgi:hypothetical protein
MQILQENGRGKSDVPMIMGVIGFVATIPGTLCAGCMGACASVGTTLATGQSSNVGSIWILINLASAAAGLFFGIKSKGTPRTSGAVMIGVALLTLLLSFVTFNWFWGLIAVACFGIGGAISLTQEKLGGTDPTRNLAVTENQTSYVPPVYEQKHEHREKETVIVLPPAPPVVQNPPANPPVQHYAPPVQHQKATFQAEPNPYADNNNNRQNGNLSNLWIWGLVTGAFILVAVVVVLEFLPSKNVAPEKTVTQNESQNKPPVVTQPTSRTPTASTPVTESAVSIGYVKTKTGSTLRMRKEPSETAGILINVPDESPVIILGYDDHASIVNGETGKWCKIKFNDKTGWAWGSFIIQK